MSTKSFENAFKGFCRVSKKSADFVNSCSSAYNGTVESEFAGSEEIP